MKRKPKRAKPTKFVKFNVLLAAVAALFALGLYGTITQCYCTYHTVVYPLIWAAWGGWILWFDYRIRPLREEAAFLKRRVAERTQPPRGAFARPSNPATQRPTNNARP